MATRCPNSRRFSRRTDIVNCYEDPTFRQALEDLVAKTGRRHIIISGVTIGTCFTFPTLSMLQDGYSVFPVVDACGAWNAYEAQAAMSRMANSGASLASTSHWHANYRPTRCARLRMTCWRPLFRTCPSTAS
ncbi:isochorismatase family protein [Cupriavidus sp. D39]|uniref:isochorismatase family protein n=1 Tax=Cupriavidus sp. D39 TaxID=2997877 RepID=UPI0022716275|nr:isochorismatase family protein [Cupriavidus sp. D39]MCY0852950.1 isochorismatase family protein [Cupriavidus sp. D39]